MTRRVLSLLVLTLVPWVVPPLAGADQATGGWQWPLATHRVVEGFDPPSSAYGAGHRGVDLAGHAGDTVTAVAAGTVTFVGTIGGVPAVVVDHGRERSTYQPVRARVRRGDGVTTGQSLGTLLTAHGHCVPSACLHLGRRIGAAYLDPLDRLTEASSGAFRLIDPDGPPPEPPALGSGELARPVPGPVTSPFGMRVHPITGVRKLHDGIDLGSPCGTPVHAAAAGTVIKRSQDAAYGKRVLVRHAGGLVTAYNHLSSQAVRVGQSVARGQVVGRVGATGLATGCHLHFMVIVDGSPKNPADWL